MSRWCPIVSGNQGESTGQSYDTRRMLLGSRSSHQSICAHRHHGRFFERFHRRIIYLGPMTGRVPFDDISGNSKQYPTLTVGG